ncbi:MAG: hypothetical protein WC933_02130 [Candidatus Paceibacterota bacterium]|jgi:hypothetical protein
METKYQTSFIPKKPVTTTGSIKSGGMSLFLLVSVIIFLVSLGLAGYVFIEKQLLVKDIAANQKIIEDNRGSLVSESNTIEDFVSLNSRINVASSLLSKHIAVSPIFSNFIQQGTLKSVRFKNFSFNSSSKDTSGLNRTTIQMSGVARDWETVASQADEFGKPEWKRIISEPKISNLTLNNDGSISFSFTSFITQEALIYGNSITNN